MPRLITDNEKTLIIINHLKGISRDEISNRLNRGGATISRVVDEFEKEVGSKGLERAAEEFRVSQIVNELRDLSVNLKKENIVVSEAKEGVKISSKLKKRFQD